MIKILSTYGKRYKLMILGVFVFCSLQVATQLLLPRITQNILIHGVEAGDTNAIIRNGVFMIALSLLSGGAMIVSAYLSARVTASIVSDCKQAIFDKVLSLSVEQFGAIGEASLLNRISADTVTLQMFLINALRSSLIVPLTGIGTLIIMLSLNFLLGLVLLFSLAAVTVMIVLVTKAGLPKFARVQRQNDLIARLIKEKLTGVRLIRAFNKEAHEIKKLSAADEEASEISINAYKSVNFLGPGMQLIMSFTMVIIYYIGSVWLKAGSFTSVSLIIFLQYVLTFVSSLSGLVLIINFLPKAAVSGKRINEVLDLPDLQSNPSSVRADMTGPITFSNVSYGYEGAEKLALSGLDFVIIPGKTTAFIGATGSGKSTVVKLIMGLIKPKNGQITISGTDISRLDPTSLTAQISLSPQNSKVFQETIMANLCTGNPNMTAEEALFALDMAAAKGFVSELSGGVSYVLAKNGMNVSGGQRQRLSVARALSKQCPVYIFDDCFSALDAKTNKAIHHNITKGLQGKTVIIVAQNIRNIKHADNIILLDGGTVLAQGSHDELLAKSAVYREIYETQQLSEGG